MPWYGNHETHEEQIIKIIKEESLDVNDKTLRRYMNYLKKKLTFPCLLKNTEGDYFDWVDDKKNPPNPKDTFELLGFCEDIEKASSLFVKVRSIESGKKYELQLFEFEAADGKSKNAPILDLYAMWIMENL